MLNKIIGALVGAILITMSTFAVAEHESSNPMPNIPYDYQPAPEQGNGLYWLQLPVICGVSKDIDFYLKKHNYKLVNVSVGREKAKPDGPAVFVVSYYVDPTYKQSIVVMSTLDNNESCMLYKSFDLTFDVKVTPGQPI